MTSKEMEERSGVPRANIRYYEAEGLLHPERLKNGYRSYSEEDLRTLEKIKLLRRLGVSVEEVRALIQGGETLDAVLDRRLAALGSERASLGRVQAVCGAVRDAGVSFDELDAGRYLQDLDAPALPEENGSINISEEVIAAIAVGAVREVEGVSGMMTSLGGSVTDLVNNKKNAQKGTRGVKIDMTGAALKLDLYLTVRYGTPIPEVAENAQKAVSSAVEAMTGCSVEAVNIHVGGVTTA